MTPDEMKSAFGATASALIHLVESFQTGPEKVPDTPMASLYGVSATILDVAKALTTIGTRLASIDSALAPLHDDLRNIADEIRDAAPD